MSRNGRGGRAAPNGYKVLSMILAFVLLGAAITEAVLWKLNYIVFQNPNVQTEEGLDNSLVMTPQNSKLMSLSVTNVASENGEYENITLTATVKPDDATDKSIEWSVGFKDPESEWAVGKTATDYVTILQNSENSVIVSCNGPFGAQIVITAISHDNAEAKAQCTVDFVKRVNDFTVELRTGGYDDDGVLISSSASGEALNIPFNDSSNIYMSVIPVYTVGTIEDDFTYTSTFTISDSNSIMFFMNQDFVQWDPQTTIDISITPQGRARFNGGKSFIRQFFPAGKEEADGSFTPIPSATMEKLYSLFTQYYKDPLGTFKIDMAGKYSSLSKEINMNFTAGTVKNSVESVDLDQSGIIF